MGRQAFLPVFFLCDRQECLSPLKIAPYHHDKGQYMVNEKTKLKNSSFWVIIIRFPIICNEFQFYFYSIRIPASCERILSFFLSSVKVVK